MGGGLTNVFVYGTLVFPRVIRLVAGVHGDGVDAVLTGYRRYMINDRARARVPAIVPEAGGRVAGKLFRGLPESQVAALDAFECVERGKYERCPVEVTLADAGVIGAETYLAGPAVREQLSGEWDPDAFERLELDDYVGHIVARFLQDRG